MTKKKQKVSPPIMLRIMRSVYPWIEKYIPWLSQYLFRMVFYVPLRYPVPEKEADMAKTAKLFRFHAGRELQGYSWGESDKPYILFVHGWAGRAMQFRKFFPVLQQAGYRIIAFDGPAHGKSTGWKTSILEFEAALKKIVADFGPPHAVVTHSFGGGAVLFAAMNGLSVDRLINIASPTIGDEILKTFLRAINASWVSAERFKKYVERETGQPFETFTGLHAIHRLPQPVRLLLVYDEDDRDVIFAHAEAMIKAYPKAALFRTRGLGHTRILRQEEVIDAVVSFIRQTS